MIFTQDVIENASDENQQEFALAMYRHLYGDEWDDVKKLKGFPRAGKEVSNEIWKKAVAIDREKHPDVMPGGLWLNNGFSTDETLDPWEVVPCEYAHV